MSQEAAAKPAQPSSASLTSRIQTATSWGTWGWNMNIE
jgi:hypothetical protein